ncbi:MAG: prepilin-type N-terminal cleavage/methylation domain-containing protein [Firmicutes bacterium]|nr:prepilin-type N-terminal cleavage/methylation domain-containing protein [Bacillota bacterium]
MHQKNTKGLTLMELIIVLALLAIIAAILIPMFVNTTDRARLRSDIQSARVIQNAIDLYRVETGTVVSGANADAVMRRLAEEGYLELRNSATQTDGAVWYYDDTTHRIYVNIYGSPESVRGLYESLSDAEKQMVMVSRRS